ncbi:MAG: hypothetical protein PWQ96_1455, partial [Clostridia bacterium]|nr:hypothetical protein [Clostridia bacterium]
GFDLIFESCIIIYALFRGLSRLTFPARAGKKAAVRILIRNFSRDVDTQSNIWYSPLIKVNIVSSVPAGVRPPGKDRESGENPERSRHCNRGAALHNPLFGT